MSSFKLAPCLSIFPDSSTCFQFMQFQKSISQCSDFNSTIDHFSTACRNCSHVVITQRWLFIIIEIENRWLSTVGESAAVCGSNMAETSMFAMCCCRGLRCYRHCHDASVNVHSANMGVCVDIMFHLPPSCVPAAKNRWSAGCTALPMQYSVVPPPTVQNPWDSAVLTWCDALLATQSTVLPTHSVRKGY